MVYRMFRARLAVAALLAALALAPAPAEADDNLEYIIPAAVAGVVAVVVIVAIVMADRSEPEMDYLLAGLPPAARPPTAGLPVPDGITLAPGCAPRGDVVPLFCW